MKKFMFSAIAMIAFVGNSMAAHIAEKDLEIIVDKVSNVEGLTVGRDCRGEQAATIKYAKEVEGMSDKDANTPVYMVYFSCKSDNVGEMSLNLQQIN
jgi:hypothetical protein